MMKKTVTQGPVLCAESNSKLLLSQHTEIFVISEENETISCNANLPLVLLDNRLCSKMFSEQRRYC